MIVLIHNQVINVTLVIHAIALARHPYAILRTNDVSFIAPMLVLHDN